MSVAQGPAAVRAFAPATVSNVACGFDVFGFAVDGAGDAVTAHRSAEPGVRLAAITGDGGRLPPDAGRNTAGIAVSRLLAVLGEGGAGFGIELSVEKGMPLKSGLGSSAASAAAALVAADALLEARLPREALLECAVEAERQVCGAAHADNAAPSLYGGFVLVRGGAAPRVTSLPVPEGLATALFHPHLEVDTGEARALLGEQVPLKSAVAQWGNTAALVAALFRGDWELLADSLVDSIAEPVRSRLVPGYAAVKAAALGEGALGAGLSGSGPTVFALCRGEAAAGRALEAMSAAFTTATGLPSDGWVSPVGTAGARVLSPTAPAPLRAAGR